MVERKKRPIIPSDSEQSDASDADSPTPDVDSMSHSVAKGKGKGKKIRLSSAAHNNEEEEEGDEDDEEGDRKPKLLIEHANGHRGRSAVNDDDDDEEQGQREFERDETGYVAGSIVRIKAENFVTYDHVEFSPGTSLNMVLGPNGTGKSTIACAIALGLGFPPKVLGRSTKLADFVKTGETECMLEIELKGHPGTRNSVIRRHLTRENEKSRFLINGSAATAKEVAAKMEELNVQVGNLCTFLPQDRVASFAQMSPIELLKETQKAAGDRRLTSWHADLIQQSKTARVLEHELGNKLEDLRRKRTKQAEAERDLAQFQHRRDLERELSILALVVPNAEYFAARAKWTTAKEEKNELQTEVAELEAANKPFMDSISALEDCVSELASQKKAVSSKQGKVAKDAGEKVKSLAKCESDVLKVREALENTRKDEAEHKASMDKLGKEINKLREIVDNVPEEPDVASYTLAINEKNKERAEIQQMLDEIKSEKEILTRRLTELSKDEATVKTQGLALQSQEKLLLDKCRNDNEKATYLAMIWFKENKHKFKGKVYEPPRFTVQCKDPKFAALAEAPISRGQMKTFLFELQEDYDFMMSEVNDKGAASKGEKIRVNGQHTNQSAKLSDVPRKFSDEQLKQWGFDCLAIDLITGPEAVLAWLARDCNLAAMPVNITNSNKVDAKTVEASRQVSRYYTLDGANTIKYSRYGAQNAQVEQRHLGKAWVFGQNHADPEKLAALKQQMLSIKEKIANLKREHDSHNDREGEFKERLSAIDAEKADIGAEREKAQAPKKNWLRSEVKLKAKESELAKLKKKPSGDTLRARHHAQMVTFTEKRVRLSLEHKDLLFKAANLQLQGIELNLRHLQYETDLRAMSFSATEKDRELNEKKAELDEKKTLTSHLHTEAKRIIDTVKELNAAADEDVRAEAEKRDKERPLQDLIDEQSDVEAQLAVAPDVGPGVLKTYQTRKAEIEHLERVTAAEGEKLEETQNFIKKTEAKWLPKLKDLIERISKQFAAAFDTLGLLGEVLVDKNEDYEKWGITIMVAFRDTEKMQPLTAQRQSGGERALTTVMYLMALAELAKAPFALVDEINQGMDQRVERNVHNALVATTCKDDVGQYFLITPKLLPNLEYHPKMKVLIINNGDWLPVKISLKDLVAAKRKRNAAGKA